MFRDKFDIMLLYFLYYSAYRVGKDEGRNLDVILIVFALILDSFFNDFWRSCWHDFITTLNIMLGQVPDNAKPMSTRMRSRSLHRFGSF